MKRQTKIILGALFFFLFYALLGFARDYFFVKINVLLYAKFYHSPNAEPIGSFMQPFDQLNYETLYYLKFPFTLIWAAVFLGANYFLLKTFARHRLSIKMLLRAYVLLISVAFALMLYSYLLYHNLERDEYTLSRWLVGIAQSPLPGLILLGADRLIGKNEESDVV